MYQLLLTACYVSESIENDKQMINNSICFDCRCKKKKKKKKKRQAGLSTDITLSFGHNISA